MKVKFFNLAKRLAAKADHHTHCIGCCIVKRNNVIGVGYNQLKTHPRSPHPYKSTHAELSAILDANRHELKGADLYLYRQTKTGQLAMSKPCKYCEELIRMVGISRVFYSCNTGFEMLELDHARV